MRYDLAIIITLLAYMQDEMNQNSYTPYSKKGALQAILFEMFLFLKCHGVISWVFPFPFAVRIALESS